MLLPQTGSLALIGDECGRGVQLAVDTVNRTGGIAGKDIVLVPADAPDQSSIPQAAQFLLGPGRAAVLLGTGDSSLSYPGSAAAEVAQIPYIEIDAPADGLTTRGFKFLLRTALTTTMIAGIAITALTARFAGKSFGLLFSMDASCGAIAAAALTLCRQAGIAPLLSIGYAPDVADLHEPVGRLRRAGVEVIVHAAGLDDVLVMFQAMQDTGWRPQALIGAGAGYAYRDTAILLGNALSGTLVAAAPFYPAGAATIATAYMARFGTPPRAADSLTAYTGAMLVFNALNSAGGDPGRLLDVLRKTILPAGALVNGWGLAFDKSGQNQRSFATLQQWRGQSLQAA